MNSKENSSEPGSSSGRTYAAAAGSTSPSSQPWWKFQTTNEEDAMEIALKRSKDVEVRSRNFAKQITKMLDYLSVI